MKKNTFSSLVVVPLFCLLFNSNLNAQMMLREVPLKKQIDKSSLVVEGKVVSKESFWNADRNNIYTMNTIEVYKVFKGDSIAVIDVVTPGGTVDGQTQIVVPSLKLNMDDIGVFTLYDNNTLIDSKNKSTIKKFKPYSSLQGYYKYDLRNNIAKNPFGVKQGISFSFYNEIMNYTKSEYVEISSLNIENKILKYNQNKSFLAPEAIILDLTTATAGTEEVLTITGTGFGSTKGKVGFRDADSGGNDGPPMFNPVYVDALDSQVLTWSDTQITVQIPSTAGTGDIRVIHNDNSEGISAASLTISYALINSGDGLGTQHFSVNGNGDITWQMNTDFDANTAAKAAFMRAFESWRCETGINWLIGANTSISQSAIDNVNVITFDNVTNPLPDGVLGQCSYVINSCIPRTLRDFVGELDIVFDDDVDNPDTTTITESWYFGTGLPSFDQFDFESVALHELGHGHQLGHVIDSDDVMHFGLPNSVTQRVLNSSNKTGAGIIQNFSTTSSFCGTTQMTNYTGSCNLGIYEDVLEQAISLYPNPSGGQFYIKNASFINLQKAVIYDISGRLISEYDLSNSSRTKAMSTQGVSKGIYFVSIHSDLAAITKKIILE